MKYMTRLLLVIGSLCLNSLVHAENGCPAGMIPYSGTDISSCGPIPPGYNNNQSPSTPPMRWADRWGAIATDTTTGSVGTATNMPSKNDAQAAAASDCHAKGGDNCVLDATYFNQCVAMVVGDKKMVDYSAGTVGEASKHAMEICSSESPNCKVYYSACSLPERIQ